jgi:hypothetical protein
LVKHERPDFLLEVRPLFIARDSREREQKGKVQAWFFPFVLSCSPVSWWVLGEFEDETWQNSLPA